MIETLIKIAIVIGGLMTAAAYFVLLERRMAAWVQDRVGPNRVGAPLSQLNKNWKDLRLFGLGQPAADGVKFILKEEYTPAHVDKRLFVLAPISILVAALATFAVIPFGSVLPAGLLSDKPIEMVVSPGAGVGMLVVFALSSIAVYGVILGGWASNNKFSFLGALRSSAQLIAYELPLGLGILGVILATGSLDLDKIIAAQAESGWWFAFTQPLGFFVFFVAAFAEAARLPFDLPECEEYSGIKLLLFLVAEFLHMIAASFLIVMLFFGGWHFWFITGAESDPGWIHAILRVAVLMTKIFVVILFFMLVRWSWPRFRFDQLMALAWKVMLPLGLINFVAVAVIDQVKTVFGNSSPGMELLCAAVAWGVCIAAWVGISLAGPLVAANRPRLDLDAFDIDPQL
ncbi:MAG: NADH-quinone oxidoreductase subunit H [Planctomycetia bacterium]|nr:NADH-quinone oxidoreductase subunit H [Planctomycetia bacterium]